MPLSQKYDPHLVEAELVDHWHAQRVYEFNAQGSEEVFSIDTPPATVSGYLHLGHVYSYSHTDFIARFRRMQGKRVFYPMGFDDNGLPTERYVEKLRNIRSIDLSRQAFIEQCLQISEIAEEDYRALWTRLGLSVDWNFSYRTIGDTSRRISQWSFIDLVRKGYAYHKTAPGIWCAECHASLAQADLNDADRETEFVTLSFILDNNETLPVATTRPELLAACVGIFIHPSDMRYTRLIGKQAQVPLYNHPVPILADPQADPGVGTGAVMCCTFGDSQDISWWYKYKLPRVEIISEEGRLGSTAGPIAGMPVNEARQRIKSILFETGFLLGRQATSQTLRVHERCDTPIEYRMIPQWFISILENKNAFLSLGDQINWYPDYMKARYLNWVENLNWDWCLSRQRHFGVPFPVWYCQSCGEIHLADEADLPVDPIEQSPNGACKACGSKAFGPEKDVMDTWATSSLSPQIVGQWRLPTSLYEQVFPFTLRPQAHDIIRTWVFYTVVKSYLHFGSLPWRDVAISGWGIAGEGMGKISKSRGGGPLPPMEMIERYSADALRYWAASTGPGKDAVISEEKIQSGQKLVTKLWNVARFAERFLTVEQAAQVSTPIIYSGGDLWILARSQQVIRRITDLLEVYDYAAAKNELESFFWHDLADNYLEMCKQRLYDSSEPTHSGAVFTLSETLLTLLRLFSPIMPFVTEKIYLGLFHPATESVSIHNSRWPEPNPAFASEEAIHYGSVLVRIASAVRKYKSGKNLPLGLPVNRLQLATVNPILASHLLNSEGDIKSITRVRDVEVVKALDPGLERIYQEDDLELAIRVSNNQNP